MSIHNTTAAYVVGSVGNCIVSVSHMTVEIEWRRVQLSPSFERLRTATEAVSGMEMEIEMETSIEPLLCISEDQTGPPRYIFLMKSLH